MDGILKMMEIFISLKMLKEEQKKIEEKRRKNTEKEMDSSWGNLYQETKPWKNIIKRTRSQHIKEQFSGGCSLSKKCRNSWEVHTHWYCRKHRKYFDNNCKECEKEDKFIIFRRKIGTGLAQSIIYNQGY